MRAGGAGLAKRAYGVCHRHEDVRRMHPAKGTAKKSGFEPERVVATAKELLAENRPVAESSR